MKNITITVKEIGITTLLLTMFFGISLLVQRFLNIHPLIPMFFTLAVFLVSKLTTGYFLGVFASLVSVLAVNYAFTFPHFRFNFTISENLISAIIMLIVTIMTSTMTTQIKKHEQKKREIETERIRANLLRAVSHDIRTPLTAIYGSSTTFLECYDILSDDKKIQLIRGIREDAEWLNSMVENLISVTKIEDGRLNLQKVDTSIEELVDVVLAKFKRRYPDQEIVLSMPDSFVSIQIDPILIEQVILNILENAMQHAEGMKTLRFTICRYHTMISFEIADDGCGIPENIRQKLFKEIIEKSGNMKINTKRGDDCEAEKPIDGKRYNMGIGMYVCAAIIEAHQGEFYVKNLAPAGCSFRFLLRTEVEDGK